MADEKIITIKLNETEYKQAVEGVINTKLQINKLRDENKAMSKDYAANSAAIEENNVKLKNLTHSYNQQTKALIADNKEVKGAEGAYRKLELEFAVASLKAKDLAAAVAFGDKSMAKAAEKAATDANKLNQKLKDIDKEVGQSTRYVGEYERGWKGVGVGLQSMPGTLGNVASSIASTGKAMLAFVLTPAGALLTALVATGAAIFGLVRNSMDFSKALSELEAITGATGDDLDFLKEKAKELGAEYGKSATEIVEAMKMVGSAKPELLDNVQALSDMTESVIVLSKATGLDLTESTSSLATIMNQFGLSAIDANKAINVLAAGSKYGAVEVDYLKDSIVKVGTIAASAGLSIEQTTAAMELFGQMGVRAETAGTGFKSILGDLQKDTKNYTNGVFDLNKAIDNNANISNDNIALQEKFGKEFYGLAGILFKNKELFNDLTEKITGTNVAFEQAAIASDNLTGDLDKMKNSWGAFLLSLEDGKGVISNTFRTLVQWVTEGVNALKTLSKDGSQRQIESINNVATARLEDFKKWVEQAKDKEKYINQEITAEKNLNKQRAEQLVDIDAQINRNKQLGGAWEKQNESLKKQRVNIKETISSSNAYINSLGGLRTELNLVGKDTIETKINTEKELTKAEQKSLERQEKLKEKKKEKYDEMLEDVKSFYTASIEEIEKLDIAIAKEFTKEQEGQHAQLATDVDKQFGKGKNVDVTAEQDAFAERKQNYANFLSDKLEIASGNIDAELSAQQDLLNFQMNQELAAKQLTEEQKAAIEEKYHKVSVKLSMAALNEKLSIASSLANAVATIVGKETKLGKAAAAVGITINAIQGGVAAVTKGVEQLGPVAGAIVGGIEATAIGVSAAAAIKEVYATPEPNTSDLSNSTSKTTVSTKFHTGSMGDGTENTKLKDDELQRTLQYGEIVLSQQSSNVFNSLLGSIKSMGGSSNITNNVGVNASGQAEMIAAVVGQVMANQKSPVVVWKDKEDFETKMVQFQQNKEL